MATQTKNIVRLLRIMARLRGPAGCPWDREQTHRSLRHNLVEECYEVLDAMDSGNMTEFRDELGDLLLQIVFHAQMADEAGEFDFDSVAKSIADKLVRRHPHVFGKTKVRSSAEVLTQWEQIKKAEKNSRSIYAELPRSLPALVKADKIQRKAARVGFDWKRKEDIIAKIEEELRELKAAHDPRQFEEELGDVLFAAVNLARYEKLDAEELLNRAIHKFVRRFQQVERAVHNRGRRLEDCSLEELDALWESSKRQPATARSRPATGTRQGRARRKSPAG
jgi:tetrapyrrole methylase family protein/MazG family protein